MDRNPDWKVFLNMDTTNYRIATPMLLHHTMKSPVCFCQQEYSASRAVDPTAGRMPGAETQEHGHMSVIQAQFILTDLDPWPWTFTVLLVGSMYNRSRQRLVSRPWYSALAPFSGGGSAFRSWQAAPCQPTAVT